MQWEKLGTQFPGAGGSITGFEAHRYIQRCHLQFRHGAFQPEAGGGNSRRHRQSTGFRQSNALARRD